MASLCPAEIRLQAFSSPVRRQLCAKSGLELRRACMLFAVNAQHLSNTPQQRPCGERACMHPRGAAPPRTACIRPRGACILTSACMHPRGATGRRPRALRGSASSRAGRSKDDEERRRQRAHGQADVDPHLSRGEGEGEGEGEGGGSPTASPIVIRTCIEGGTPPRWPWHDHECAESAQPAAPPGLHAHIQPAKPAFG